VDITTSVSYSINVHSNQNVGAARFGFASRDIGCTQGTTLTYNSVVIARFRPGTRYWDRALESAQEALKTVFERLEATGALWDMDAFNRTLQAVLTEQQCLPWDGNDLDGELE
jgi:hypothetical protein